MLSDYTPIKIEKFRGLFARGGEDLAPIDHFITAKNLVFNPVGFQTRPGFSTYQSSLGSVYRMHVVKLGSTDRILILKSDNTIYDGGTAILTVAGMTDFSCVTFLGRAYITPHNGTEGLTNKYVYVYTGSGTARKIGGAAPSESFLAADATPGSVVVDAGVHLLGVVYETNTGFLTPPGPVGMFGEFEPVSYTAPGDKAIEISSLDAGDSTIVWKRIIATKAGLQEYFFVPNGAFLNVTTSGNIAFTDDMLVDSADYLFDMMWEVPSGVGITEYAGRLVIYGFPDPDGALVRASLPGEPESFSSADGFVVIDKDSNRSAQAAFSVRGSLYVLKEKGLYVTQDNGLTPSEWDVQPVDFGVGSTVYGVSEILDHTGHTTDKVLIADEAGIFLFDGVVRFPDLTWKIHDEWLAIPKSSLKAIQIAFDPIKQALYALINQGYGNSYLLMGDCSEGMDAGSIKWSKWSIQTKYFQSIGVYNLGGTGYVFRSVIGTYGFGAADIVELSSNATFDYPALAIATDFCTSLVSADNDDGGVCFFGAVRVRANGYGAPTVKLRGLDSINQSNLTPIVLQTLPGKELLMKTNFQNERAAFTFQLANLNEWVNIDKIIIFGRPLWQTRP